MGPDTDIGKSLGVEEFPVFFFKHQDPVVFRIVRQIDLSVTNPAVLVGLFVGAMLVFVFGALTMSAVQKAAQHVVVEVRRQFREIAGIMEGEAEPDYESCVDLCTTGALRAMVLPALLAVVVPIATGLVLGVEGVRYAVDASRHLPLQVMVAAPSSVPSTPGLEMSGADFAGAVHEVHIVSTGNECKELLLVLGRGRCVSPLVVCANDEQVLSYKAGDNSDNHTTISDSALAARNTCNTEDSPSEESANDFDSSHWKYLYEPNASIMKAGCFDVLEQRFAVHHISPNSHLFVAAEPIADFPGRSFAIESIATMNKKELKQLLAGLTHANIAVRNFPLTVAQLRKKLKLKDGGNTYLFATTDAQGRHLVLRTKKRKNGSL